MQLKLYEIRHGRQMQHVMNDKDRFSIKCMNINCLPWKMTARRLKHVNTFIVKECHREDQHKCQRNYKLNKITSSFVANEMLDFLKDNGGCNRKKVANCVKQKAPS